MLFTFDPSSSVSSVTSYKNSLAGGHFSMEFGDSGEVFFGGESSYFSSSYQMTITRMLTSTKRFSWIFRNNGGSSFQYIID